MPTMKAKKSIEKISRLFYRIANLKLKIVIMFGNKRSDGSRSEELFAYEYKSSKYLGSNSTLIGISLDTKDYLVLEGYIGNENKETVFLSYPHIGKFRALLKKAIEWLNNDNLFYLNSENKIDISMTRKRCKIANLAGGGSVTIKPGINEKNFVRYPCINFFLNDILPVSLSKEEIIALKTYMETFDLFTYSQGLINYVELLRLKSKLRKENKNE